MSSHLDPATPSGSNSTLPSDQSSLTLDSLSEYANIQEERIKLLLEDEFRPLGEHERSVALWRSAWGKTDLLLDTVGEVKRDPIPDRVNDSLIDGVVPDKFGMMVLPEAVEEFWKFRCRNIFIRPNEYEEAEKAALVASQRESWDGLQISGQPGIGLFIFHFVIYV